MQRDDLVTYLDAYLRIAEIPDYGPQGLQVEAEGRSVTRIALAVDVAPPVIAAAARWGADMLIVHHGLLWSGVERISGPLGRRVRDLLSHNIHLYAAHLPLDAHPQVGNNAVLAQLLDVSVERWWGSFNGTALGVVGTLSAEKSLPDFVALVNSRLHTQARVLAHGPAQTRRVAILSGGGAGQERLVKSLGADTYLTGETSHSHYWAAADLGLNVIFGGHYATETVGVRALGRHLSEKFGLAVEFFDFPTAM